MEVRLEALDAELIPQDTYVSIRIGSVQKLSRFAPSRTFHFPESKDGKIADFGRIEVYKRIGVCSVPLAGLVGLPQEVQVALHDSAFESLGLRLEIASDGPSIVSDRAKEKAQKKRQRLEEAQKYIADHNLEELLATGLRDVMREQPENPASFLSGQIMSKKDPKQRVLPPLKRQPSAPDQLLPPMRAVSSPLLCRTAPSAGQEPSIEVGFQDADPANASIMDVASARNLAAALPVERSSFLTSRPTLADWRTLPQKAWAELYGRFSSRYSESEAPQYGVGERRRIIATHGDFRRLPPESWNNVYCLFDWPPSCGSPRTPGAAPGSFCPAVQPMLPTLVEGADDEEWVRELGGEQGATQETTGRCDMIGRPGDKSTTSAMVVSPSSIGSSSPLRRDPAYIAELKGQISAKEAKLKELAARIQELSRSSS